MIRFLAFGKLSDIVLESSWSYRTYRIKKDGKAERWGSDECSLMWAAQEAMFWYNWRTLQNVNEVLVIMNLQTGHETRFA